MNKRIETERLILRPIKMDDAGDIFDYARNENVGPNAGWKPHTTIEETKEIMKIIFIDQENVFGIVLKDTKKLIGTIGLITDPKRENDKALMLGYAIGEEYWGKGYTAEAAKVLIRYGFDVLQLDLVSVYCYPYNQQSKRVIEKCEFKYEGRLALCEKRYDGVILDNECYAIVK